MDTAGSVLKTEREKQGKSLEEIGHSLKLNIEYLRAIEKDKYNLIPAEIYTKAYLRFYAQALGLEGNHIIDLYQKEMQVTPVQKPVPPKERAIFSYKPVMKITFIILFIVSIILLVKYRVLQPVMEAVRETKEPEAKIQEQETPALQERKELSLSIAAADTTWISVRIDGSEPKEWLLKQGERITLSASERFLIITGNAGSTKIIFNGEDLGALGEQGQVVEVTLPKNVNE